MSHRTRNECTCSPIPLHRPCEWARRASVKRHGTLLAGLALLLSSIPAASADITVSSPSANVEATISIDGTGRLQYVIRRDGKLVIDPSDLGVVVDGVDLGTQVAGIAATTPVAIDTTFPWRGVKPVGIDRCNEVVLTATRSGAGDGAMEMVWRAYDDGVAFRYRIPGTGLRSVSNEGTNWVIPAGTTIWTQLTRGNYEGLYQPLTAGAFYTAITMPSTCILPGTGDYADGYAVITEAALYNYSGAYLNPLNGSRVYETHFQAFAPWEIEAGTYSPWRVTMCAETLNELVNSTIIPALNPAPSPELATADWIKPGKSLWSWWYRETLYEDQVPYINAAVDLGFDYVLWDEDWEYWPEADLNYLLQYAQSHGIGVWLWKRWTTLDIQEERDTFFGWIDDKNAFLGSKVIVGVKIDFMDSEFFQTMLWYEAVLQDAADHELMINFHGTSKPTGHSRTYPNEMTREGIRGLEYHIWNQELDPSHNAALPFTRMLTGHADYTPVTFWDERLGDTSYTQQLAMAFLLTSPLTHWADYPSRYQNSIARDVIEAAPTLWDETVVLPGSAIGEVAGMARRKGDQWFIAVINGDAGAGRNFFISLSFLDPTSDYESVELRDYGHTATAMHRSAEIRQATDYLNPWMRGGGGFVAMLTPTYTAPPVPDFDSDNDVDMTDFGHFQACHSGRSVPLVAGCEDADLDRDNDVDSYDFGLFNQCLTGAAIPLDPDCNTGTVEDVLPDQASLPTPTDEATNVSRDTLLTWTPGTAAQTHRVYFGAEDPPPFHGEQTNAYLSPGLLAYDKTYYWRIDEVNDVGTTTGVTWSFTTEAEPIATDLNRYELASFQAGSLYYRDREYIIQSMPTYLVGAMGIKTDNDDKHASASSWLTFNLSAEADVYVAVDSRMSSLPLWLQSYTDTGETVAVTDGSATPMRLYHKTIAPGAVVMGGNLEPPGAGADSNYWVMIVPTGN